MSEKDMIIELLEITEIKEGQEVVTLGCYLYICATGL